MSDFTNDDLAPDSFTATTASTKVPGRVVRAPSVTQPVHSPRATDPEIPEDSLYDGEYFPYQHLDPEEGVYTPGLVHVSVNQVSLQPEVRTDYWTTDEGSTGFIVPVFQAAAVIYDNDGKPAILPSAGSLGEGGYRLIPGQPRVHTAGEWGYALTFDRIHEQVLDVTIEFAFGDTGFTTTFQRGFHYDDHDTIDERVNRAGVATVAEDGDKAVNIHLTLHPQDDDHLDELVPAMSLNLVVWKQPPTLPDPT